MDIEESIVKGRTYSKVVIKIPQNSIIDSRNRIRSLVSKPTHKLSYLNGC